MARVRNIAPGFFENEDLAEIGPLGQVLFAGLWCWADREGRLADRPKRIKAGIFPYYDADVNGLLNELASAGFIRRYTVAGSGYVQIVHFAIHQHPHPRESASTYPGVDEADPDADLHLYVLPAEQDLGADEATPRFALGNPKQCSAGRALDHDQKEASERGITGKSAQGRQGAAGADADEQETLDLLRELPGWPKEKKAGADLAKLRMWRKVYPDRPSLADISAIGSWLTKNGGRAASYLFVENWLKRPEKESSNGKARQRSRGNPGGADEPFDFASYNITLPAPRM